MMSAQTPAVSGTAAPVQSESNNLPAPGDPVRRSTLSDSTFPSLFRVMAIAATHSLGPHGETWVPTTQPVGEDFSVSASTQITITNWAADDHGDTPAAATELTLDDYSLPGRIDKPGDVDVFRVTPVVSGTLVVRVTGYALGFKPHIRLLAADGVTVLKSVDFNPHGDDYFFVRLEAVAGEPIYVEVRDQSGSASGGIYRVSAGDPLADFKEHVTSVIYLPMLTR